MLSCQISLSQQASLSTPGKPRPAHFAADLAQVTESLQALGLNVGMPCVDSVEGTEQGRQHVVVCVRAVTRYLMQPVAVIQHQFGGSLAQQTSTSTAKCLSDGSSTVFSLVVLPCNAKVGRLC